MHCFTNGIISSKRKGNRRENIRVEKYFTSRKNYAWIGERN